MQLACVLKFTECFFCFAISRLYLEVGYFEVLSTVLLNNKM